MMLCIYHDSCTMSPRINPRNTYYLRNVHNQQHLHVSSTKVTCGTRVEDASHQVSIHSVLPSEEITSDIECTVEIHPSWIRV